MRVLLLTAVFAVFVQSAATPALKYPAARRGRVVDDYHGTPVEDPYRWLEQTDSAETKEWLRAQARLASARIAKPAVRGAIERRVAALWNRETVGVPWREAGRLFYVMSRGGDEQPVLYSQDDRGGAPSVVLDPNRTSHTGSVAFRDYAISPDGKWIAYAAAEGGADAAEMRVRSTMGRRDTNDTVSGVIGSVCWTRDAHGFFYLASAGDASGSAGAARIGKQLAYHVVGAPQAQDPRLARWDDNYRWAYCMLSEDGRRAIVVAERGSESEVSTIDLGSGDRPDVNAPVERRLAGHAHTPIGTIGNTLYLITDDRAPHRRIASLDLADRSATIQTVVSESRDVIEDAALTSDHIVVHYLSDVKSRLRLFALDGSAAGEVSLPGAGSVGWGLSARSSNREFFYSFASFLTPPAAYRYDEGTSTPIRRTTPMDTSAFETRQVFYRSKDGTRVPMFITARKDAKFDGSNATLLTAYGGYGSTLRPAFQPDVLAWLQLGGVYAVANIRGGGEYGEEWHRAGMLAHKQTSFDDFIAAAEYLVEERLTAPPKLAMYGHSNGGLLVGAVLTQRPDLFGAAVANAGHYDMLRYPRFTVGAGWIPEYGSPDDPEAFTYLRAYSPLHNVRAGTCYPATLLLAGDHDDRVVPSHAYKFAAALQAAQSCDRPIVLRVARQASHSYASRNARISELSDMWAFIALHLGVPVPNE